jgi:hypothetical protein
MSDKGLFRFSEDPPRYDKTIEDICLDFKRGWSDEHRPLIEDYLSSSPKDRRSSLLKALLQVEFSLLNEAGQAVVHSQYEARFPDYLSIVDSAFDPRFTLAISVVPSELTENGKETAEGNAEGDFIAGETPAKKFFYYTFVVIPSGEYIVGSVSDEPERAREERRETLGHVLPTVLAAMSSFLASLPGLLKIARNKFASRDRFDRIFMGFSICTETCANGLMTGMTITMQRRTRGYSVRRMGCSDRSEEAVGTMVWPTPGAQNEVVLDQQIEMISLDFGWR